MGFESLDKLTSFYHGTRYTVADRVPPPRPSEWHLPLQVWHSMDNGLLDALEASEGAAYVIPLSEDAAAVLRSTLLHESLFALHKGFYNYLAARRLYGGGLLHWIEITDYYAKLYLARATVTLCGIQKYWVRSDAVYFVPEIFAKVNPKKFEALRRAGPTIDWKQQRVAYSMAVDLGLTTSSEPQLRFDITSVDSHKYIWGEYGKLDVQQLGLTSLLLPETVQTFQDLIDERNRENYSFDGYAQVDFNLPMPNFRGYFERDYVKRAADIIYDDIVGQSLISFMELCNLLLSLRIEALPLKQETLAFMIDYTLDDGAAKDKLLDLCAMEFPLDNEYYHEGLAYISGEWA